MNKEKENLEKIWDLESTSERIEPEQNQFEESEIMNEGRPDISIIYTRTNTPIVNEHGLIEDSQELYSSNEYPNQREIRLDTCEDGFQYLIDFYHFEGEDGYGVEVYKVKDLKK